RFGLTLTSFGQTSGAPTGARLNTVTNNCFAQNGFGKLCTRVCLAGANAGAACTNNTECPSSACSSASTACTTNAQCPPGATCTVAQNGAGVFYSAGQVAGTISTNHTNNNNIDLNNIGA